MKTNKRIKFPHKEYNEDWISFRDRYNRFINNINDKTKDRPYSYLMCIIPLIPTTPTYFP